MGASDREALAEVLTEAFRDPDAPFFIYYDLAPRLANVAVTVLSDWLAAHDAAVRAEAEAERDAYAATVERVRALCDEWVEEVGRRGIDLGCPGGAGDYGRSIKARAQEVRAALDTPGDTDGGEG